ncbi:MAG: hypothetical protein ABI640_21865 [Gammaproteobacteria bacterium]
MSYRPDAIPDDTPPALKAWLADQLRRIAAEMNSGVYVEPTGIAPTRPRNGAVSYAIAPWATDLGFGGFVGYEAGAWRQL